MLRYNAECNQWRFTRCTVELSFARLAALGRFMACLTYGTVVAVNMLLTVTFWAIIIFSVAEDQ